MGHYALIGGKLGHSFSQRWFEDMFAREGLVGYTYALHEMSSLDGLRQWVTQEQIDGFNVTIPYKKSIISMLDTLSPEAQAIGAVNCVCVDHGRLIGNNTDAPAFGETLDTWIDSNKKNHAFILGTGGAAHAVGYALKQRGIEYLYVSRNPEKWNADNEEIKVIGYTELATNNWPPTTLIINATPVGMWPDIDSSPWPCPEQLNENMFVYDLIYNPSPTLLMRQASERGARTTDGLAMLHRQAELSWQLWQQL